MVLIVLLSIKLVPVHLRLLQFNRNLLFNDLEINYFPTSLQCTSCKLSCWDVWQSFVQLSSFKFDFQIYPASKDSIRNRVALLITNIKFTEKKFNRNGAEKDEENMEKLLRSLGYEVVKYTNLTGKVLYEKGNGKNIIVWLIQ